VADGHRLSLGGEDLGDRAGDGRGQLHVDLVGGQLDDGLALLDDVADLRGPLEDRSLLDGLPAGGRDDVDDRGVCWRHPPVFGCGRLVFSHGGPRRGRAAVRGDLGEQRADGDGLALGGMDLDEGAGCGRRNLGVDLVGGDLDERLVGLDRFALLLVPLQDGALADRLAHRRERHLNCCVHRHAVGQL
jgi:hypothetical protein